MERPDVPKEAELVEPMPETPEGYFSCDRRPETADSGNLDHAKSAGIAAKSAGMAAENVYHSVTPAAADHIGGHLHADESRGPTDPAKVGREFRSLDPRSITLDRITSIIFTLVVTAGALIALAASLALRQQMGWWWLSIPASCGALILLLFWLAFYWPSISYRFASYRLAETGLEIRRGVLWRHQISVPAARVQHVDVAEGPLQRQFGLASLVVHTAGTTNASVTLEGLASATAQALRDELIRQRESLDVT